jgi:hypothetical protein
MTSTNVNQGAATTPGSSTSGSGTATNGATTGTPP